MLRYTYKSRSIIVDQVLYGGKMEEKLNDSIGQYSLDKYIHKLLVLIEYKDMQYKKSYNMDEEEEFILASVTKLFTTASILYLFERSNRSLDDSISRYFSDREISKLCTIGGKDYSKDISVKNLLYQNSGLPSLASGKISMGQRLKMETYRPEILIGRTKAEEALYRPGQDRSFYTSINFILLGKIIERICSADICQAFSEIIFKPLSMDRTYMATKLRPGPKGYFKDDQIDLGEKLINSSSSGGAVSTGGDMMKFIRAFFNSYFFDIEKIKTSPYYDLQKSYGPIKYGLGHMKVDLEKAYFLGHNGISGAFAFYNPGLDLYMVGTFNQFSNQALSIDLCRKILDIENYC